MDYPEITSNWCGFRFILGAKEYSAYEDELHLHRVSLGVFDFNTSAIACYERAGFKKEGLLRDVRMIGDEFWSLWEMSILQNEWRAKQARSLKETR